MIRAGKTTNFLKNNCGGLRTPNSEPRTVYNKGFTLIEIIIMIVMAGILLPAIILPFATGVKGSGKPEMVTRAMYLAHERMEYLMKYHYLNAALNPTDFVVFPTGDANYPGENQIYYVDSNFAVVGDGIAATNHRGYKRIIVRVRDPMSDTYEIYSVVTFFP
jgi:Tfp pilus assembly protein PilE